MKHNPLHYLKPAERGIYAEYVSQRIAHMERGTHYWQRIAAARDRIKLKQLMGELPPVEHAIPYADPYDLDAPVRVCHPSPMCVHELMVGGIHPPVEAHLETKLLLINEDGSGDVVAKHEALAYRQKHSVKSEIVVDYRRCHDETMGPLTYQQAIEWILQKDVPVEVWARDHNRPQFAIVPRSAIPKDRTNRNAWKLADLTDAPTLETAA